MCSSLEAALGSRGAPGESGADMEREREKERKRGGLRESRGDCADLAAGTAARAQRGRRGAKPAGWERAGELVGVADRVADRVAGGHLGVGCEPLRGRQGAAVGARGRPQPGGRAGRGSADAESVAGAADAALSDAEREGGEGGCACGGWGGRQGPMRR